MSVRIYKSYKKEVETDELDFVMYDELKLTEDELEEMGRTITKIDKTYDHYSYIGESIPINIDRMINELNELKKLGSTHVEIMHHGDHHSYCLNGVEIRRATKEEVKEADDIENAKIEEGREKKRKLLEEALAKLNK